MDILVNQLGFKPDKAAAVSEEALEKIKTGDHNSYVWVNRNPVLIALPFFKEYHVE
jgi:hypothetical protein